MTRRLALCAFAVVAGSACGPAPGAVKVVVSYAGPREGCLVIRASPTPKPTKVDERRHDRLPRLATRTIGIIPSPGEGEAVTVVIEVHERGCEGSLLWRQELSATAARPATLLEAQIVVRDQDDDTWADARGTFAGGQTPGTDCDDSKPQIHPGAVELCNGLDDDCNDVRDDGLPPRMFFVDLDNDGWGNAASDAGQTACLQPPGYAADAGDCDDVRAFVNPGSAESCNGVDDNCDLATDEGFGIGELCDAGCGGAMQCTDAGTAACVSATPLLSWYVDNDEDGHGKADAGSILACVQPPGRIPSSDDCDDNNRFIHVGAREVCDGMDDDCDPSTLETCSDGGLKGFVKFPMPTSNAQWRAIAPFARGFTWVVGEGNQIALRIYEPSTGTNPITTNKDAGVDAGLDAGETDGGEDAGVVDAGVVDAGTYDAGIGDGGFVDYSGRCTGNFRAAWATASGRVYLGESNKIDRLEPDGGCIESWFTVLPFAEVSGLSGVVSADGGITVFATAHDRRLIRVTDLGDAGASNDRVWLFDAGTRLYTVSAMTRDTAVVGGDLSTQSFFFGQVEADAGVTARALPPQTVPSPIVLASSSVSSTLGYYAGNNNTLFRWEGQNAPSLISGPGPATSHFVGLSAFGQDHVLVVDGLARVWRYHGSVLPDGGTGAELWIDLTPATSSALMRAMKATAPDDIWVVGDQNNVLHFGE